MYVYGLAGGYTLYVTIHGKRGFGSILANMRLPTATLVRVVATLQGSRVAIFATALLLLRHGVSVVPMLVVS